MAKVELFGTSSCPHTKEMREWLEWRGEEFTEYDVEVDPEARRRIFELSKGQRIVPILVEDGRVTEIGWRGAGCILLEPTER